MEFIDAKISDYSESHTTPEPGILSELNRETYAKILMPRMLSGHLQGRLLSMLSHMIKPNQVLEIGTYTGYSAIRLAEGLSENGMVHTIDINDELHSMVESYISKAGLTNKIKSYVGNAVDIIPTINSTFDLVFIDADKENYSLYFDMVLPRLNPGGFILADNVLWSGKVFLPEQEMDPDTIAIHRFNKKINADTRIEHVLLPIRDGLMLIRKK